jgi:hypothetical protein
MFKWFGKWLLVLALIFSVGGHWAFLQTVAWVGMTVSYSQNDSISKALSKTFDGKHPCKLCQLVKKGKTTEQESDSQPGLQKLDFFSEKTPGFYFSALTPNPFGLLVQLLSRIDTPPLPPPLLA